LIQDYECPAARELLVSRRLDEARALVARLCRAADLQATDVADAQQETFFIVDSAIDRFDLAQLGGSHHCHFRTFLHRVVHDHVCNLLARRARDARRAERVRRDLAQLRGAFAPRGAVHWLMCSAGWGDEPSLAAEKREALADLRQAVAARGGAKSGLWEDLLAGLDPKALARQWDCSASAVRRERAKMVRQLSASVRGHRR
jgi:RNA polymerase sigma factor (sigma-70 family)